MKTETVVARESQHTQPSFAIGKIVAVRSMAGDGYISPVLCPARVVGYDSASNAYTVQYGAGNRGTVGSALVHAADDYHVKQYKQSHFNAGRLANCEECGADIKAEPILCEPCSAKAGAQ